MTKFNTASTPALKSIHDGVSRAFEHDRNLSQTDKMKALAGYFGFVYHETDTEPDWRREVDEIEKELSSRKVQFTPIK